jgi:hypothetical protein
MIENPYAVEARLLGESCPFDEFGPQELVLGEV